MGNAHVVVASLIVLALGLGCGPPPDPNASVKRAEKYAQKKTSRAAQNAIRHSYSRDEAVDKGTPDDDADADDADADDGAEGEGEGE